VNFRNPAVRQAQLDVVRGWLARGVDGFRLDVFNTYFKHPDLPSNPGRRPPLALAGLRAWGRQVHVNDRDQPELGEFLAELRSIVDAAPGRMTVGELFDDRIEVAATYSAPRHLIFDFDLLQQPWQADRIAAQIDRIEAAFGPDRWPALVLSNHDQPRTASRLSRGAPASERDAIAKAAAVLLLTLRGTPFLYYGEEIGLGNVKIPRGEIVDPPARRYWPLPIWWNRDQCRTPMPWEPGPNAGFTIGRPWLRMAPDAQTRNVAREVADPGSVLAAYRRIIALRRELTAVQTGAFRWLTRTPDAIAYARGTAAETVVVAINFRGAAVDVPLDGWPDPGGWRVAWSTAGAASVGPAGLRLAAHEAAILRSSG
jgi:alpha-glucosidase